MQRNWMLALATGLCLSGGVARATLYNYNFTTGFTGGTTVSDGNNSGWTDNEVINNITGGDQIQDVTVHLNMSGGYAGDMYGYLVLTDTSTHAALGFSVLINRVGTGSGGEPQNSFGYSDSALNITLADGAANGNIHNYQTANGGSYQSLISSGAAFSTDGGSLGNFAGAGANNTWTLFLADQSSGNIMQVNSWGLDINTVPEPVTWAILIFGALVVGVEVKRRLQLSKEV